MLWGSVSFSGPRRQWRRAGHGCAWCGRVRLPARLTPLGRACASQRLADEPIGRTLRVKAPAPCPTGRCSERADAFAPHGGPRQAVRVAAATPARWPGSCSITSQRPALQCGQRWRCTSSDVRVGAAPVMTRQARHRLYAGLLGAKCLAAQHQGVEHLALPVRLFEREHKTLPQCCGRSFQRLERGPVRWVFQALGGRPGCFERSSQI